MKRLVLFLLLIAALCGLIMVQSRQLQDRPILVKLGPPPHAQSISFVAGPQKPFLAWSWITRVMLYFGSLVEPDVRKLKQPPEHYNMYKRIEAAVRLDPYNMDAYYFAQAAFTWEVGRVKEVNALLRYGMDYRTWDYQLPFYAGFNAAYFLHDYAEGARWMQLAAERSGNPLLTRLAARYFHQAQETDLGIAFLETIVEETRDPKLHAVYQTRLEALRAVKAIEDARDRFQQSRGRMPSDTAELVDSGLLKEIPDDPYGGTFYLTANGNVESTSRFAFTSGRESSEP